MKKVMALLLAMSMVLALAACGGNTSGGGSAGSGGGSSQAGSNTSEPNTPAQEFDIIWVSCSTASDFWQYQQIGMENAVIDMQDQYNIKINFSTVGPAQEAQTEDYLAAFENAIASKPDAIISATQVPDSTRSISKAAMDAGIVVNFTNCGLETLDSNEYSDCYNQFYTTVSADIGDMAGKWMLEQLQAAGLTEGTIAMEFSMVNPSLQPRMDNFQKYIMDNSDFVVLDCKYNNNDLNLAQQDIENEISTYGDKLVGIYGANNISGDGIALAVQNAGIADKVITIGVDSDPTEIQALEDGYLDAIFVQDAYGQGYAALKNAVETLLQGSNPETEQKIAMPPECVTTANMKEEKYAALLDPSILKK